MTSRCRWQPIPGVNRYGQPLSQLLCDDCGPHWRDLSARNAASLKATAR